MGVENTLRGKTVLVTGSNGAIGEALVGALLGRGAAKVYAARNRGSYCPDRDPYLVGKVVPVGLSITDAVDVAAAARRCSDVDVVINNAFVSRETSALDSSLTDMFSEQVEVNCFGTLGMCLAYAPVLASRGGGLIVNVCSSISQVNLPHHDIYRLPLAARRVRVIRAYPANSTTAEPAMAAEARPTPEQLAELILTGVESGEAEIRLSWPPS